MPPSSLNKIWSYLGPILALLALTAWISSQTKIKFTPLPIPTDEDNFKIASCVFGLFLVCPTLAIQAWVGILYIKRSRRYWPLISRRRPRLAQVPVTFGLEMRRWRAPEVIAYQYAFLFGFIIMPTLNVVHMLRKFFIVGEVITPEKVHMSVSKAWFPKHWYTWLTGWKCDGVDFIPFFEPLLLTLISVFAILFVLYYLRILFLDQKHVIIGHQKTAVPAEGFDTTAKPPINAKGRQEKRDIQSMRINKRTSKTGRWAT